MNSLTRFVAIVAALSLCTGISAAQYSFSNSTYWLNDAPQGLASGDLDADGFLDLVVTATNPDRLEVWMNDTDGTYTLGATLVLAAGADPRHLVLADFNGDLLLDAACLLYGTNELQLATGLGGGAFALGATFAAGLNPVDIETADADGDQDADLLVVNQGDDNVTLFFNDGAGVMTGMNLAVGDVPHGCTFGDFDGDADWDFAVSNTADQTVSVYENQGQGVFGAWSTIVGSHPFFGIVAGDLDGDQDDDLAVVATDIAVVNDVSIFLSDGLGGWGAQTDWHMPVKEPGEIAIGDLDCDGDLDLAVGLRGLNNGGFVALGNDGAGAFPNPERQGRGLLGTDILMADLDNDGNNDVAGTSEGVGALDVSLNTTCNLKLKQIGTCNSLVDFEISGATPLGNVLVVIGHNYGSFVVPPGKPCAGAVLDLDPVNIRLAGVGVADANGEINVSFWAGPSCCGQIMQVIDQTTCKVSNTDML